MVGLIKKKSLKKANDYAGDILGEVLSVSVDSIGKNVTYINKVSIYGGTRVR